MNRVQQIEPITSIQKQPNEVLAKLTAGPVILASYSKPAAVLVSIEEWDSIADELNRYRVIAESKLIAERNDAADSWVSSEEMQRIMEEHGVHVGD